MKPLASGSGKLVTPWARMHCEYSNALELPDPPVGADKLDDPDDEAGWVVVVERPPAGPVDPGFPDEGPGWVVVVDAAGTVVADEAVVPMWATELGGPPPHADKPKVSTATTAISGTVPRRRGGRLPCAIQAALSALSERSSLRVICSQLSYLPSLARSSGQLLDGALYVHVVAFHLVPMPPGGTRLEQLYETRGHTKVTRVTWL